MYLTAHRVRSRDGQSLGINVFLYDHHGESIPGMSWDAPEVRRVEERPGVLVGDSVDLVPGGNEVLSYLDVVAADGVVPGLLVEALRQAEATVGSGGLPFESRGGRVAIRFGAQTGLEGSEQEEFRALEERAILLLSSPTRSLKTGAPPLEAEVALDEQGFQCALTPESIRRLRPLKGPTWRPARISVSHDTAADFQMIHADLKRELIPMLTGLQLEQVLALGGFRFIEAGSGRVLRQWPESSGT